MPVLQRFDTPARLPEPGDADRPPGPSGSPDGRRPGRAFPQFFDPTPPSRPRCLAPAIAWTAFPATLLEGATSEEQRWGDADASRGCRTSTASGG